MQEFDKWNEIKKVTQKEGTLRSFKNRDIFYMKMGQNIGYEQNGKGNNFVRPVVVLKKFNKGMFFGVPLSTQIKEGAFYYKFSFQKNDKISQNIALLSQMKLYSSNRLLNKIGVINQSDFENVKIGVIKLID